jgi:protein-tyrosine-phosphatase
MGDKINIVAVCTGNICRSPMAAGILSGMRALSGHVEVSSAGTHALDGNLPSEFSVIACRENGIDISGHRARRFDEGLCRESDMIVCMEPVHVELVLSLDTSASERIYNLADFSAGKLKKIADPYGCSLREYRQCFRDLLTCLGRFLESMSIPADRLALPDL